jgi:hypothetical protein
VKPDPVRRLLIGISAAAARRPVLWLLACLVACVPAYLQVRQIRLDTNLIRLLPKSSPAATWTRTLEDVVSDGGYLSVLFEGPDREKLIATVERAAARIGKVPGIATVDYVNPRDFMERYRYLLVPEYYLGNVLDELIGWEAELSPAGVDLLSDEPAAPGEKKPGGLTRKELEDQVRNFADITTYQESRDGTVFGMIVRPRRGVSNFGEIRRIFAAVTKIADEEAAAAGIWSGVGGSLRNKISEYDLIVRDLNVSGTVSAVMIVLFLVFSFRSLAVIPFLLFPVGVGLLFSYAFVPWLTGGLNTITAFLLLVLFGVGVENPIHLMKRFQYELLTKRPGDALRETFSSTAPSVVVSGLTTAVPLFILTVSDFRGFSEFGLIAGVAVIVLMTTLLLIMPASLALGQRLGLIRPRHEAAAWGFVPPRWLSLLVALLVAVAGIVAAKGLRFDYDFTNLKAVVPESTAVKERHVKVYPQSLTPSAVYVVPNERTLDAFLHVLEEARHTPGSRIGRITSIRDFAPSAEAGAERRDLIVQIQEQLSGRWVRRIEDPESRRWIDDIRGWEPPAADPAERDLPAPLRRRFEARDGSGELIVGIYPNDMTKSGLVYMAFTKELYGLALPPGVRGPVGETPLFAEILWIVLGEGPWLVLGTLLGIAALILLHSRSVRASAIIVLPLLSGVTLALGTMAVSGLKLNFFNVIVIPTLLGMGVDFGVHYYRRWQELGRNLRETQQELLEPLTTVTVTTIMGYSGMVFASHPGLESIGIAACLGLVGNLLTYTMLVPGLLRLVGARGPRRR